MRSENILGRIGGDERILQRPIHDLSLTVVRFKGDARSISSYAHICAILSGDDVAAGSHTVWLPRACSRGGARMAYGDPSGVYSALRRDVTALVQFVRTLEQ